MISADSSGVACRSASIYSMTYRLARHVQDQVGWCWRQGFYFGRYLFVIDEWSGHTSWMSPVVHYAVWWKQVFAISIGTACVAPTSSRAISWEILSEQDAQRIDLGFGVCIWYHIAIGEGVHAMLLQTLRPNIVISHRSICTLHSISRFTQHTSRTTRLCLR